MKTLAHPSDVEEIRGRLLGLRADDVARWGEMNVGQMMCHLREAFGFVFLTGEVPTIKMPVPPKVMKWAALRVPKEWPKSVPTLPELKIGSPTMQTTEFGEDKKSLMASFERFLGGQQHTRNHPFMGTMKHEDWTRWGYLHTDHHLRQFGR